MRSRAKLRVRFNRWKRYTKLHTKYRVDTATGELVNLRNGQRLSALEESKIRTRAPRIIRKRRRPKSPWHEVRMLTSNFMMFLAARKAA